MGEPFLVYAKELFQNGKVKEAYDMALLVARNDRYCRNAHLLLAIYGVLLHRKDSKGRVDCYKVLGVASDASDETIAHRFTTLKKRIAPALDPCPAAARNITAIAAEAANSLLNFAFEVLADEKSRSEFDSRRNPPSQSKKEAPLLPPPPPPPPQLKKKEAPLLPPPPPPQSKKNAEPLLPPPPQFKKNEPPPLPPPPQFKKKEAPQSKKEVPRLPPLRPQSKEAPIRRIRVVCNTRKSRRYDPIDSGLSGHHRRRMQSGF